MCNTNLPDKYEGNTGCVRETPHLKMKPATGCVRKIPHRKGKPVWDVWEELPR